MDDLNLNSICQSFADTLDGVVISCNVISSNRRILTSTLQVDVAVMDSKAAIEEASSDNFLDTVKNLPSEVEIVSLQIGNGNSLVYTTRRKLFLIQKIAFISCF